MAGPHSRPNPLAAPPADDPTLTLQTALPSTIAGDGRAGPPADPPVIPRYTIGRRLGYGGMGVVYEAIGPVGVAVALKVIHPDSVTPDLRIRFHQEARAMMALDHPHLARIYDYGDTDAGPYFTMRLLSGRTLADLRPAWARDPAAGLRAFLKAVDAVAYLHVKRLVHRDLKPSNILLDDADEPFVSDLGLVKELAGEPDPGLAPRPSPSAPTPNRGASPTMTQTGKAVGTRAYMAPEQAAADHSRIGPPTDVYALGRIAGEIAWGFRPTVAADGSLVVPGDGAGSSLPAGVKAMLREILPSSDPPPPEARVDPRVTLSAGVETEIRRVIAKALAWDPAHRYPTAGEFGTALAVALDPPAEPAVLDRRPTRRRALAAGGVAVCGLGAWAAWAMLGPRPKNDPPPPEDPLAALQREFEETGVVELLKADGTWRWSEFLGGGCEWHPGAPDDGPPDARGWFAPPEGEIRLLELGRGLPPGGFRFVVEVAHGGPTGEVGAYVGRSVQTAAGRPNHCFLALKVKNPAGRTPGERSALARACLATGPREFADDLVQDTSPPALPAWTTVALELTEAKWTVTVDETELTRRTRNRLLRSARNLGMMAPPAAAVTPTFQPTEGLGVFAARARVAVRSARLERPAK